MRLERREQPARWLMVVAPVLAILAEGQVRITKDDGSKVVANAQDGFLSIESDVVTIVAGNAALVA